MNRFLMLTVIGFAAAAILPAAAVQCPTSATLQDLINLNATGGCFSQDKLFNNFSYTPATNEVPAGSVNVTLVLQTGISDVHGWTFIPTTAWTLGWTLSYDISVLPGNLFAIVGSKDQMNSGFTSTIVINDVQTGVTPSPLTVTGVSAASQTVFSDPYNLQTVHTVSTATIPAGQNLVSYKQNFFQRATPATCGCTFTQGYWSSKPGVVWPASLPQRTDLFFNSGLTYQQIMDASLKGGNAYLNLAHQYIAAVLNGGNGACAPQSVLDLIAASTSFFSGFAPGYFCASNPSGCPLQVTWAGILADYNQGTGAYAGNPGHCSE